MFDKLTKRKLVDNWDQFHKWASTRLIALAGTIMTVYQMLPDQMKSTVPPFIMYVATMVVLGAAVLGRITQPVEPAKPAAEAKDESDPANPA